MNLDEIIAKLANGLSVEEFLDLLRDEDDKTQQTIRNAVSLLVLRKVNALTEMRKSDKSCIKRVGASMEKNAKNIQVLFAFMIVILFITIAGFLQQNTNLEDAINLMVSLISTGITSMFVWLFSKKENNNAG